MNPRTLLCASISALLPVGLWGATAFGTGDVLTGLGETRGGWLAVALAGGGGLLLFLGFRNRTGRDAPGLAAACGFASFPSLPDAMASSAGLPLLAGAIASAALILVLSRPEPEVGRSWRFLGVGLFAAAGSAMTLALPSPGASALLPGGVLLAPGAAVLAGETALLLGLRGNAAGPRRGGLVVLFALVLAAGAALGFLRARSWEDPISFWKRAAVEEPRSPSASGALAEARAAAGDLPGAGEALRRFTEQVREGGGGDSSPEALRRGAEGAVRASLRLLREEKPGRPGAPGGSEVASAAIDASHLLSPGSPVVLHGRGERLLLEGNFPEAVTLLREAVSIHPDAADAWDALARALIPAARPAEALDAAQRATGMDPASRAFRRTYAEALLAAGRSSDALTVLREALGSPPFDPATARAFSEAERRIGLEEISAGNRGRARRLLGAGLAVDPFNFACLELKAELDRQMEAERPEYEALITPGPEGTVLPDHLVLYAVWLCRWGEFETALPHFQLLLERFGNLASVHFYLGREYWEAQGTVEGHERAILAYRDTLARDPGWMEARNRLWQVLRTLGRLADAREEARRFLDADRAHPDAYDAERFLEATGGLR